ncbi:MAG TPA: VCBS repeat-containing protein, partial [Chitinophagaceae bacterium]|nr:VCBS repeat-containing protein [Chitinophagaceae bacterium]
MLSRLNYFLYLAFYSSFFLAACTAKQEEKKEEPLFEQLGSAETGITFTNKVIDTEDFNLFNYRNFYNGCGVAIGDINNDGLADIFFTSNQLKNKLYINKGNWKFEDVSAAAGIEGIHEWHTGVTLADINGDSWLDIYVSNSGGVEGDDRANELYINEKDGTFREAAQQYGLDDKGLSTQAAFFDYDHDGDLDCYVLNNSYRPIESFGYDQNMRNIRSESGGDKLYRNDNGKFTDVSAKAGIYGSEIGFGLGITVGDVNNDGWDDLYISNDFFERDYLYINQQNGTFEERIKESTGHISQASMGSDITDINNDGYLDIFTTDMLPEGDARLKTTTRFDDYDVYNAKLQNDFHHQFAANCLQLNNGDGTFSEIAQYAGVSATDWSWGALSFDFDNDGWKDLFVSNGISRDLTDQDFGDYFASDKVMTAARAGTHDYSSLLKLMPSTPIPNYGFLNRQDLSFRNATDALGFGKPGFSNGAAYGDLDNDGDTDLVINNENMEAFVYRNNASKKLKNSFLKVALKGTGQNTFGVGARVTIYMQGKKQVLQQMPTRGFESSVEPVLNFGLGKATSIDSLVVLWPNMKQQSLYNLKVDTMLMLNQQEAKSMFANNNRAPVAYFSNVTNKDIKGRKEHHENNFIDFDVERLIPKMLSFEGPKLALADVNNDGLEDFFMGGATGDTAKLLMQTPSGDFIEKPQLIFGRDKDYEDIGAVFFDADQDGDQDLVVASGGNQFAPGSIELQTRLYLNDGHGNFIRAFAGWPQVAVNASCV